MSKSIIIRLAYLILLWLLALWLPWWFLLLVAVVVIWFQPNFYELMLVGFWYDSVYGPAGSLNTPAWPLLATLISFLLVWISTAAKEELVLYRRAF